MKVTLRPLTLIYDAHRTHYYITFLIHLFHFYNINHIIKIKQSNKDFIEILLFCEIKLIKKSVSIINNINNHYYHLSHKCAHTEKNEINQHKNILLLQQQFVEFIILYSNYFKYVKLFIFLFYRTINYYTNIVPLVMLLKLENMKNTLKKRSLKHLMLDYEETQKNTCIICPVDQCNYHKTHNC